MNARNVLSLILLLALAGCGKNADVDRQSLQTQLDQLLAERVESAKSAQGATRAAFEADTVTLDLVISANDELWKAELAVAHTPDGRIAAHSRHVEHQMQIVQKIMALFEVGARGGEAEKEYQAECSLQNAQIALIEACIALGLPESSLDAGLLTSIRFVPPEQ